ncbi:proteasome subunit alpha type-1 [Cyclospora cayetanensis]|uniref:Proteasome subunit alpha type-1 n=2 Tax=Cyclospora cayetanensis TaxID=88456 RepID=A0A6P5WCG7_9EIME|nr:proteasome subunit alpha type-1 [Cyclospora cayetanensis]
MYRNLYDTDCITWSPQGRVFQVEYAKQAVTQGTCCVGLRSNSHVVLCSLKKSPSKLAGHQQKLFCIDDHIGVAISGITADAKVLCEIMRNACLQHKFTYDTEKPAARLALLVADKCQNNTQRSGKRPYGVGLLIAACDSSGPRLFENCPSGNYYEYNAIAFGARSQASKTYLERHFETFSNATVEELLLHGAKALKASMAADTELTADCLCVGIVGCGQPWRELTGEELQTLVDRLSSAEAGAEGAPMVVETPEAEKMGKASKARKRKGRQGHLKANAMDEDAPQKGKLQAKSQEVETEADNDSSHSIFKRQAAEWKAMKQQVAALKQRKRKLRKKLPKEAMEKREINKTIKRLLHETMQKHEAELKEHGLQKKMQTDISEEDLDIDQ